MRNSTILDALFPAIRMQVLSATVLRPEKSWFLTELAAHLETRPSSLQREIESLSEAGILRQWRDGRRLYFMADSRCPIFPELRGIFEKTAGIVSTLQQEFTPFAERIDAAFVYGSIAEGQERTDSDVDLMIVGRVGLSDLVPALRRAEARLGRPINPMIYSMEEFRRKAVTRDHFLTTVLAGKMLFLKGGKHELAAVA
jgi:predicted nucleotidyltransferase